MLCLQVFSFKDNFVSCIRRKINNVFTTISILCDYLDRYYSIAFFFLAFCTLQDYITFDFSLLEVYYLHNYCDFTFMFYIWYI